MRKLDEVFEVHEQLNPKLYDGNKLRTEVREKLLNIVEEFKQTVTIPFDPIDIIIVGSNASFNYTEHSDIDTHIVINFDKYDSSKELLNAYYNLEKSSFNSNYDITIHGIEVELYVEDTETSAVSNGVYSVMYDKWIKYPQPIQVKDADLSDTVEKWKTKINDALNANNADNINNLIDKLYVIRKQSIMADGEYGKGNQLFKEIRNLGLMDQMKDKLKELKSNDLTLESMDISRMMELLYNDL